MIQVFNNPIQKEWTSLLARPGFDASTLLPRVQAIINDVRENGDDALLKYTKEFDQVQLQSIALSEVIKESAEHAIPNSLKTAIQLAKENIEKFHLSQLQKMERIETMPGVWCWRKSVGIENVGIYIPGGTAPLFSTVLMLGIPAKIAGCKNIILCTPPNNDKGEVHPAIIYAATLVGVTHIYTVGGVQAIAAMAYGTATISKVHKIFGPGNQYVTAAKQLVQQNSKAIIIENKLEALELINQYAPEHLIMSIENAEIVAEKVVNAGSVFIGNYSPESVGDYASGTNHTLPTNGYANAYSGVSVDSFVKKITFQQLTERGLVNIGKAVMEMAGAEGLDAHENAVAVRLNDIASKM